jgi:hypothetical protein
MKRTIIQAAISVFALIISWIILSIPLFHEYIFQCFCFFIAIFLFVNLRGRHQQRSALETETQQEQYSLRQNVEIGLVGVAIFLLIGSTGGLGSALLPLFFVYFFFAAFVTPHFVTLLMTVAEVAFFYFFTLDGLGNINFGPAHYPVLLSIFIFIVVTFFAQKYYNRAVKDNLDLQLEKEKVAYYNIYAEKKQSELLNQAAAERKEAHTTNEYLQELIPQIDALQKQSRFAQNQLIVSAGLTRIGLSLRRIQKLSPENKLKAAAANSEPEKPTLEQTEQPDPTLKQGSDQTQHAA